MPKPLVPLRDYMYIKRMSTSRYESPKTYRNMTHAKFVAAEFAAAGITATPSPSFRGASLNEEVTTKLGRTRLEPVTETREREVVGERADYPDRWNDCHRDFRLAPPQKV